MLRRIKSILRKPLKLVFGALAKLCDIFEKPANRSVQQARAELESLRPYPAHKSVLVQLPTDPGVDVSVIVPIYNTGKYVKQCVDSILAQQTSYAMQVLLIDDGSTDDSPAIVESYRAVSRVQVIHQPNGGLSAARNRGLNCARGKYVMFVDSDDVLPTYAVETLVKTACDTGAEIVEGSYKEFTYEDGWKEKPVPAHIPINKLCRLDEKMKMACFAWNKVYLRSLFETARWPENFLFEDILNHTILYQISGLAVTTPIVTYYYRNNPTSIMHTHQKNNRTLDTYWIVEQLYAQREKMGIPLTNADYLFLLKQLCIVNNKFLRKYPIHTRKNVFALGCEFLKQHQPQEPKKLTRVQAMMEKSMQDQKFWMWRACSWIL